MIREQLLLIHALTAVEVSGVIKLEPPVPASAATVKLDIIRQPLELTVVQLAGLAAGVFTKASVAAPSVLSALPENLVNLRVQTLMHTTQR